MKCMLNNPIQCSPDHHRTHDGAHSVRSGSVETTHRPLQILPAFAQISQSETSKERETVDSRVSHRESPIPLHPLLQESAGSILAALSSSAIDQPEQPERQYSNEPNFISLGARDHYLSFGDQIPDIQKFAEDLNKAVSAAWPKRSASRYSAVNVLMLRWETDKDPIVDGEMSKLAEVFSRLYCFNVDTFLIPPEKPQRMLTMRIMRFLEDDNPDTLQIVYYNGHSFLSANRETIWSR
jgi:hypothetical protein